MVGTRVAHCPIEYGWLDYPQFQSRFGHCYDWESERFLERHKRQHNRLWRRISLFSDWWWTKNKYVWRCRLLVCFALFWIEIFVYGCSGSERVVEWIFTKMLKFVKGKVSISNDWRFKPKNLRFPLQRKTWLTSHKKQQSCGMCGVCNPSNCHHEQVSHPLGCPLANSYLLLVISCHVQ